MSSRVTVADVSFRELVESIPRTTYATHKIHSYPAKFIPQVVRYFLENYTSPGEWILDPFAGSTSTGIEAKITGRNAVLTDINPLTKHLARVKLTELGDDASGDSVSISALRHRFETLLQDFRNASGYEFLPRWKTVAKWYYPEMLQYLSNKLGFLHTLEDADVLKDILLFAGLRLARSLSLGDDQVPKLFRSKRKKEKMKELVTTDWEAYAEKLFFSTAVSYFNSAAEYTALSQRTEVSVHAPFDITTWNDHRLLPSDMLLDGIITSPPYLQAQEYIRSTKLDLYWLGYSEKDIRTATRGEIPYRKTSEVVNLETLNPLREYLEELNRLDLLQLVESYFYFVLSAFRDTGNDLKPGGYYGIFVGNPRVQGRLVELWQIINEFMLREGYRIVKVFRDPIKASRLFKGRLNQNPEGMPAEFLLILQKC